jgi:hypothetical protein
LNVLGDLLQPPHGTNNATCDIEIDEKGTLKATKHDEYENIADSVFLRK